MKDNYLVVNGSTDPYYNLALEEYLLLHHTKGSLVMLWQNENTIVIGRHQNALEEINREYVSGHGINVIRRMTGGGAVYHDLGNLNYSFITDHKEGGDMRRFTDVVVRALRSLGVDAEFGGRNDILAGGKKVSGTAERICGGRILFHGCLLYDADLSRLSESLKVRSEKFISKSVKSVRSRVGNLKDHLGGMELEEFKAYLVREFLKDREYQMLTPGELGEESRRQIEKLKNEKYASWEWTYGTAVRCSAYNCRKYAGGFVEVYLDIRHGKIEECKFFGDFMARRPASEVAEKLIGCRYRYEEILAVLESLKLWDYFGSITAKEVASAIYF